MSRTVRWMRDNPKLPTVEFQYYRVFNEIYYNHRKPTPKDCEVLNISMDEAMKLRRSGYQIENNQRKDAQNWSDRIDITELETITNRKRPNIPGVDVD